MPDHATRTVLVERSPVHAALAPFPTACFTLTLLTDLAYWQTSNLIWQHFSEWLLLAGIVLGALAALAGAIDFLFRYRRSGEQPSWPYVAGTVLVLVLAFFNSLVHAGDGWTGVVPYGLILSAATVVVLVVTGWFGLSRRVVGATYHD